MEVSTKKSSTTILALLLAMLVSLATGCESADPPSTPVAETGTPVRLVFTTQPDGATARSALETQPVVSVVDAGGNTVTSHRGVVVLTITAGTSASEANLFGGTTVAIENGMVKFKGLSIDKAGTGYTLTATSGTLAPATSTPFTISPGAPAKVAFTIQPSGGIAGSPFTSQPEVTVQDRYGNAVAGYEGSVTLSLTSGSGVSEDVLSGTTTVRAVNGIARFTDVSISKTFTGYKLTALGGSLESATSLPFAVLPGKPTKLEFTIQPSGAKAGTPFETQPKVVIEDVYGNVVTSSRASVTLSITSGTGTTGATLSGTKTLIAEGGLGGLAVFTDLSIDRAGSGYMLTATSSGLTSATSQAFDVASP